MDPEERLNKVLRSRLDLIQAAEFPSGLRRRARTRRALLIAAGVSGLGLALIGAVSAAFMVLTPGAPGTDSNVIAEPGSSRTPSRPGESPELRYGLSAEERSECELRPVSGKCGELEWAAVVAQEAGFEFVNDGRGAPEIMRSSQSFTFWAFVPEEEGGRTSVLGDEGYEKVGMVDGIAVFSDRLRVTWEVHGLYVWLSGPEGIDASTPGAADLVAASKGVPWP